MCLAVPMKIIKIDGFYAVAESKGVTTDVNISLVPDIKINDKVLVHAGFAIEHLDANEAKDIEATWDEYYAILEKEEKK
ncbi:MAG TPA: HypC/HybG/HupF family hydrogenase formation chaperone [Spirochaetota bacterium]|nr:HypC/HybG/HupF family hydrogenase formation chaperone [Spirochaetota bacterium]HPI89898.1 HypC/HybG/HupF family hydrogenase formation chaperone [Spirochaetota bacterium]HPR47831.1 HypC/HybG/HupF family hydrogenase formation chaperone [Spirochaetota bacterium]